MTKNRSDVLVVDDDPALARTLRLALGLEGYGVACAADGAAAIERLRTGTYAAVILDLGLPRVDGLGVCRWLRKRRDDTPVLIVSARETIAERVRGLDAGADDYLVKPFALEELAARLHAIRRRRESPDHRLTLGDVVLDPLERRVWVGEVEATLSRREFAMLVALLENAGRVVSRDTLFDEMWDGEVDIRSNAIDVHMSRLRARLEPSTQVRVTTLRGVGYRLETVDR